MALLPPLALALLVAADPAAVEAVRDLAYAGPDSADRQKLDLYLPKTGRDTAVLLFFHGGGYTQGDRKGVRRFAEALAAEGVAVAAVGYRLAPQHVHPAAAEDGAKAVAWITAHAGQYRIDPNRLFVGGHSAGAHLAALIACDGRFVKEGKIRGVVGFSGAYVLGADRKPVFGDEAARLAASPLTHVKAGLPPFLLLYGDHDEPDRGPVAKRFADALKAVHVEAEVVEAKDRNHGSVFNQATGVDDPSFQAALAFIRKHSR